MTHLVSTLRGRLPQPFLVLLIWAVLTAWVAFSQPAFAAQGQAKAGVEAVKDTKLSHTAFTYQGQLKDANGPVNGAYDLQFVLYSAQTGGEKLGANEMLAAVLTNGLFSFKLDFGRAAFEAKESWLEIGVRPSGSAEPYTVLFPRQKLAPTPYAIFAQHEQWSLIGVPVGFAGDRDKNTDILSVDEKNISKVDTEASTAKLADKAVTATKPDDRAGTTAAMNPAGCVPGVGCSDPVSAFTVTNDGFGHGIMATTASTTLNKAGVYGEATASSGQVVGVFGVGTRSSNGTGVVGLGSATGGFFRATTGNGVFGVSTNGWGVRGDSTMDHGVQGIAMAAGKAGVSGRNDAQGGAGVFGFSMNGTGVSGTTASTAFNVAGVFGEATATSGTVVGVYGKATNDPNGTGVAGFGSAVGGYFKATSATGVALFVDGLAKTKVLQITGADLSEQFEVKAALEASSDEASEHRQDLSGVQPGMVVSIDLESPGKLVVSSEAYDHRVAGIISGAGDIKTGVLMNQSDSVADGSHPVALSGRVYCWADAANGPINPGDLLTTSNIPGHAMKATNHKKANGATIGKAMAELKEGKGLVLVLVTLQ